MSPDVAKPMVSVQQQSNVLPEQNRGLLPLLYALPLNSMYFSPFQNLKLFTVVEGDVIKFMDKALEINQSLMLNFSNICFK